MHTRSATFGSILSLILILAGLTGIHAAERPRIISVSAGKLDRPETVVQVAVPAEFPRSGHLTGLGGDTIPFQVDDQGRAVFVMRNLRAGITRALKVVGDEEGKQRGNSILVARSGNKLLFDQGGKRVFEYQAEPGELPRPDIKQLFTRGGYLHPVLSPAGRQVTDDFPTNHIHHHGIWFPWTKTEFEGRHPDFWNMGDGTGKVEFESLERSWSGPVHGGFVAHHRFVDLRAPEPKVALNETWRVTLYDAGHRLRPYRVFDLVSTQTCATDSPLILPEYRYGGLGFRGNGSWDGAENAFFLTSEGETDRVKGHATRGRWCHIGGKVDGEWTGIAILCHPDNFRAPQPMRIHPTEPFFNFAPSQAGDWEIRPGEEYVSKYRFVVLDGKPDKVFLDQLWQDYAFPAEVTLK
ncbi:MAG: PmoA family protein [Verrucomicrobia bacterium]|nr:PmoA family protein [Verrucomicrobiota bacterium]